ncbi:MAG: hypothetical protein AAFV07_04185, partial [Bacteroidota bacterium]
IYTIIALPFFPFISPGDLSSSQNFITFPFFFAYFAWMYKDYFKLNIFKGLPSFVVIYILAQLSIILFSIAIVIVLAIVVLIPAIILKKLGVL